MNKKGNAWVNISIIGLVLLILILGLITIVIFISDYPEKEEEKTNLDLFLKAVDSNKQQQPAEYLILNKNSLIDEGFLVSDSFTKIDIQDQEIDIFCYNSEHYGNLTNKKFTKEELNKNQSKVECNLGEEISDIELNTSSKLRDGDFIITIEAKGDNFQRLSGVYKWTRNIIIVEPIDNSINCGNWTKIDNQYSCNNQTTEIYNCELGGNECKIKEEIPKRIEGYNYAFATGKNLNGNLTIRFRVKASGLEDDCINFLFYDKVLRYDGSLKYVAEENEKNIGGKDFPLKICT